MTYDFNNELDTLGKFVQSIIQHGTALKARRHLMEVSFNDRPGFASEYLPEEQDRVNEITTSKVFKFSSFTGQLFQASSSAIRLWMMGVRTGEAMEAVVTLPKKIQEMIFQPSYAHYRAVLYIVAFVKDNAAQHPDLKMDDPAAQKAHLETMVTRKLELDSRGLETTYENLTMPEQDLGQAPPTGPAAAHLGVGVDSMINLLSGVTVPFRPIGAAAVALADLFISLFKGENDNVTNEYQSKLQGAGISFDTIQVAIAGQHFHSFTIWNNPAMIQAPDMFALATPEGENLHINSVLMDALVARGPPSGFTLKDFFATLAQREFLHNAAMNDRFSAAYVAFSRYLPLRNDLKRNDDSFNTFLQYLADGKYVNDETISAETKQVFQAVITGEQAKRQIEILRYAKSVVVRELIERAVAKAKADRTYESVNAAARLLQQAYEPQNEAFASIPENAAYAQKQMSDLSDIDMFATMYGLSFQFPKKKINIHDYETVLSKILSKNQDEIRTMLNNAGFEAPEITVQSMLDLGKSLRAQGIKKWFLLNAAFAGGGVSEMMLTMYYIMQEAGVEIVWPIMYPDTLEFYGGMSAPMHERLQGRRDTPGTEFTDEKNEMWMRNGRATMHIFRGALLDPEIGFASFEDPQPLRVFDAMEEEMARPLSEEPQLHHLFTQAELARLMNTPVIEAINTLRTQPLVVMSRFHILLAGLEDTGNTGAQKALGEILKSLRALNHFGARFGVKVGVMFQPGFTVPRLEETATTIEVDGTTVQVPPIASFEQHPGIDFLAPKNAPMEDAQARALLAEMKDINGNPIEPDAPAILTLGRFDPVKGMEPFIDGHIKSMIKAAAAGKKVPNQKWLIAGNFPTDNPLGKVPFNVVVAMAKTADAYAEAQMNKMGYNEAQRKQMWELMGGYGSISRRIQIIANYSGAYIGALYWVAAHTHGFVYLLSMAEGYGLTEDEAAAKRAALVVTDAIPRYTDGLNALVISGVKKLYERIIRKTTPGQLWTLQEDGTVKRDELANEFSDLVAAKEAEINQSWGNNEKPSEQYLTRYNELSVQALILAWIFSVFSMGRNYLAFMKSSVKTWAEKGVIRNGKVTPAAELTKEVLSEMAAQTKGHQLPGSWITRTIALFLAALAIFIPVAYLTHFFPSFQNTVVRNLPAPKAAPSLSNRSVITQIDAVLSSTLRGNANLGNIRTAVNGVVQTDFAVGLDPMQ
ncbi:MAG: hypothetical protein ABSH12_09275, partial [Endomicrobiales bacterium]